MICCLFTIFNLANIAIFILFRNLILWYYRSDKNGATLKVSIYKSTATKLVRDEKMQGVWTNYNVALGFNTPQSRKARCSMAHVFHAEDWIWTWVLWIQSSRLTICAISPNICVCFIYAFLDRRTKPGVGPALVLGYPDTGNTGPGGTPLTEGERSF